MVYVIIPAKINYGAKKMKDKIILTGIEIYGYHGCSVEEQKLGQKFYVDVALNLDLSKVGISDDYADTVDYVKILELAEKIVGGTPRRLIETVAEELATKILADFEIVEGVTITLHKPNAPLTMTYADAAVKIFRAR